MISRISILGALVAACLWAAPAYSQNAEFWAASEFQLTLSPETDPNLAWHDVIPDRLRVYTQLTSSVRTQGMYQLLWRVGPIWNLLPNFSYAMHTTAADYQRNGTLYGQELRLEAEPVFKGSFTPEWHWSNRHRLEYRIRTSGLGWRYRFRLGTDYDLPGVPFSAFTSSEAFFDLTGVGFNQSRNTLGLSWKLNDSLRMNLSYLLRFERETTAWRTDHIMFVSMAYSSQEDGIFQMQPD